MRPRLVAISIDGDLPVSQWVWYRISTGTRRSIASKLMHLAIILFFLEFCTVEPKLYHGKIYNVMKILN